MSDLNIKTTPKSFVLSLHNIGNALRRTKLPALMPLLPHRDAMRIANIV